MHIWSRGQVIPLFRKGPRRAIVLGGGGAKGAYQIGVWKAFRRLGLPFHVVTGTSVGALNGALMAQGDFAAAKSLWETLTNDQVLTDVPALEENQPGSALAAYRTYIQNFFRKGGADPAPLETLVRCLLQEDKLRSAKVQYGMVTVDMATLKPVERLIQDIPVGMAADYILASAACFPAFQPKEIDGKKYIDGGYYDLLPVELALTAQPPVEEIFVVDIDGLGIRRTTPASVPVTTIRSYWDLGSMFLFCPAQAKRNIRLGFFDTYKALGRYDGHAYTFYPGQEKLLEQNSQQIAGNLFVTVLEALPKVGRKQLERLVEERIARATAHRKGIAAQRGLLLVAAELAGELLGLDPTQLYTIHQFNQQLNRHLLRARQENTSDAILAALRQLPLSKLGSALTQLTSGTLLQLSMDAIRQNLMGGESFLKAELLALTTPRHWLAALYLVVLEQQML